MIRGVFTLLVLLSLPLFAHQYDNSLLDIQAKLFPKIAMLENNVRQKKSDVLSLVIVSQEIDFYVAKKLQSRILKNYPDTLLDKKVSVSIKKASELAYHDIDAVIILHQSDDILQTITQWANNNTIVTFAYDASYLERNVLVSLYLGKSTKPYINKKVLQEYKFSFDSYLLQVSKFKE